MSPTEEGTPPDRRSTVETISYALGILPRTEVAGLGSRVLGNSGGRATLSAVALCERVEGWIVESGAL